jgi:uncharacterized protein (UPF0335 family)
VAEGGRSAREQQKKEMMVSIGQNTAAAEKLTALLERMEHLLDEIDGLKDDLKDLKAQARDENFNVAAVVRLVAMRRNKQLASQENELLNDLVLYAHATGTPLDIAFVDDSAAASPTKTSPLDLAPTTPAEEIHRPNDGLASESHRPT